MDAVIVFVFCPKMVLRFRIYTGNYKIEPSYFAVKTNNLYSYMWQEGKVISTCSYRKRVAQKR